jgi:hypothetical protein
VAEAHLPAYLDEFVFRFNRRRSASRGMVFYRVLELAAGHDPVRFQDLLTGKKPRPAPVGRGWGHPPSLDRPAANRPWRTGELQLQLPIPLRLSEYPRARLCRHLPYADVGQKCLFSGGERPEDVGITTMWSVIVSLSSGREREDDGQTSKQDQQGRDAGAGGALRRALPA